MPILKTNLGYSYKFNKKIKSKSKILKIISFVLIVSVVCVGAYYFVFYIPLANIFNLNRNMIFNNKKFYCIVMSSLQNYSEAVVLSEQIKNQGGAGYILNKDNSYMVLASAYELQEDALKVKNNLSSSQINVEILELNFKPLTIKINLNTNQITELKKSINLFVNQYKNLYDLSINYDSAKITTQELFTNINNNIETCQNNKESFNLAFKTVDDYSIVYVKIYLNNIISVLKSIQNTEKLSSELKYAYFQILNTYLELIGEIS